MIRRIMLTAMTLFLVPAAPLSAQETETDVDPESAAVDESDASDEAQVAPHPHEGFDFPSDELRAAAEAGLAWIRLVDAEAYDEAWGSGSATLQGSVTPQQLKASINRGREPFRPLGARALVGISELSNPPNAPPGDYVVLQYRTQLAGGGTIIETVVARSEGDASRVAGYFIQRE